MRTLKLPFTASIVSALASTLLACGSTASDSGTSEDPTTTAKPTTAAQPTSGTSTTGKASPISGSVALTIPGINFSLPLPGAALRLDSAPSPDDILTSWVTRINEDVAHLNEDVARMNRDHKDAVVELEGDALYDYQAVVCESGKVSIFMKWSQDGERVYSERDLNQKPDAPENVRVRAIFDGKSDKGKALAMHFFGEPRGLPEGAEGALLSAFDEALQLADGNYTFRSVQDWHGAGDTPAADDYMTGTLSAAGAGEFVGWSKRLTSCAEHATFDEAAPLWCNSRQVGAEAWYTPEETATAWTDRLQAIGVAPFAKVDDVTIKAECPAP